MRQGAKHQDFDPVPPLVHHFAESYALADLGLMEAVERFVDVAHLRWRIWRQPVTVAHLELEPRVQLREVVEKRDHGQPARGDRVQSRPLTCSAREP